ncbi:uncharacterized protein LOC131606232 [Vicia villosa]|uniref:uncharacterized protein LOC131606232 n=1 Tax=Vicia villosa TaxID=3911 RepID=UPI00273C9F41|nr:uncharacterized protein LOC131606232 [Vicia villosa]
MAETIKLVFLIILFIFLFLIVMDFNASKWTELECKKHSDCPRDYCKPPFVIRCDFHKCFCR